MDQVQALSHSEWNPPLTRAQAGDLADMLESGQILYLPELRFELDPSERKFLSPQWLTAGKKSISVQGPQRQLVGSIAEGKDKADMRSMIERFGLRATRLVHSLFPMYAGQIQQASTSFRPCEAAGREQSWRHDDTRLHTDAFPSQPVQGKRILRVFTNINPRGRSRLWRIGEPFVAMAERFLPDVGRPLPGTHFLLKTLGVTKSERTEYDHIMLRFHDLQKSDADYQQSSPQEWCSFAPGTTWICYSDQVMHAVMEGQHLLEQTYYLPVEGQQSPSASPLRLLETMTGRRLAA